MIEDLQIASPKRPKTRQINWEGFFPYYAGFSEQFARELISSSGLRTGSTIHDPWNGSGTTTYAASLQEMTSVGFDLNPAMVVVAKARVLAPSEADSLQPLARKIISQAITEPTPAERDDPLSHWFGAKTAGTLRSLEISIREHLIGSLTEAKEAANLEHMSTLAAANYTALFSVCRELASSFKSSNPTWIRYPHPDERKLSYPSESIRSRYLQKISGMASALEIQGKASCSEATPPNIRIANSTNAKLPENSVDLILTSPPYCTRIDYTAATRIELALLAPLIRLRPGDLSKQMIGSIRVPSSAIPIADGWGQTCKGFLLNVHSHQSKASSGYYYQTHLDYFDKISRSLANLTQSLKPGGKAVFVVQDSYYKEIHNDLPRIISEMCDNNGLALRRRTDFYVGRTLAASHPYARKYKKPTSAIEAVLCFERL